MMLASHILGGMWIFLLGATVGSFANVCIYRIPWQKSVIWPGSHCPRCLNVIRALDNIPILGWILLRGKCRTCRLPIAVRYPLIEALGGVLFVAVYYFGMVFPGRQSLDVIDFGRVGYHLILVAFLLIATFIDYDYQILPDEITFPGMILGLAIGALVPEIRPAPGTAATAWDGFLVGLYGLLIGGGVIWAVRIFGRIVFRREAMGFGDVTLMAMIGAFLGWQIIPPALFLAAILGLVHAFLKVLNTIRKFLSGRGLSSADREIPFGPYLSMAALLLMLGWEPFWNGALASYYKNIGEAVRFMTGRGF